MILELKGEGWILDRVRGSHHIFKHPDRPGHVVVPHPKKSLGHRPGRGSSQASEYKGKVMMRYPVAIELGSEQTAFGVVVPDLPGCFSAGDTLDEAMAGAEEAVAAWIDAALDDGQGIPIPSGLDAIRANPDFAGWTFAIVSVDPSILDDTIERVNLPCRGGC